MTSKEIKEENKLKKKMITIRVSDEEIKILKSKADKFCKGNISRYVLVASKNFIPVREMLFKKD